MKKTEHLKTPVELRVGNGLKILGVINKPSETMMAPALIFAHGLGSDRLGEKAGALEEECLGRKWIYSAFDFHGHGQSEGSLLDLRGSGLIDDLRAIVAKVGSVGGGPIFMVGSSMGGWAVAWFAEKFPDQIAACTMIAPALHFLDREDLTPSQREQWQRSGRLAVKNEYIDIELGFGLVEESSAFDYQKLLAGFHVPALIFHGMRDELIPYRHSVGFAEHCSSRNVEVRLIKEGNHTLTDYKKRIAKETCDFFAATGTLL